MNTLPGGQLDVERFSSSRSGFQSISYQAAAVDNIYGREKVTSWCVAKIFEVLNFLYTGVSPRPTTGRRVLLMTVRKSKLWGEIQTKHLAEACRWRAKLEYRANKSETGRSQRSVASSEVTLWWPIENKPNFVEFFRFWFAPEIRSHEDKCVWKRFAGLPHYSL